MMSKKEHNESKLLNATFLPLKVEGLTPDMIEKAKQELKETPENKQEALKELKRFINAEKDFRPLMDDKFLLRFLRARKFNAENAIKTLKNYYTYKIRYSRLLTDILPSEVEHVLKMNLLNVSRYRDSEGSLIGIGRFGIIDINKVTVEEILSTALISTEIYLQSEATQICGAVVVVDFKGLSLRLVRHFASPTLLFRIVRAVQDCLPIRVKAFHVVNEPFYFSVIFNILKTFLSEKIKKRFQFHGSNFGKLHKEVPPAILPEEFGGQLGPLGTDDLIKDIIGTDSHFKKIIKYGYQEKRAQFIKKKSSMAIGLFL